MAEPEYAVVHDENGHRFTVSKDGAIAELNYYMGDNRMVITHVGVPRVLERRSIGTMLTKAGLEYAGQHEMEVVPLCSFVRSNIDRNGI